MIRQPSGPDWDRECVALTVIHASLKSTALVI